MDRQRIVPPLKIPESTFSATLPLIQSSRSVKLPDGKKWLMDWRETHKCVADAHNVRRNQLLDNSRILHESISDHAETLSSRELEKCKSTLVEWSNLQDQVRTFAFPSPPPPSRLLRANNEIALNAILSPRYRRQLAHQLSGNVAVRERFSLSKSLTKGVVGCHVNTLVMENKGATVNAAAAATSSSDNRFFLTETDIGGQIVANANSPRSCPPKTERFKELSEAQMETIRELSQTLSQKMKQLIDLTGMLAMHILDDQKRRQLRIELESTKLVCSELKKKLQRGGITKPILQTDGNALTADNLDLIRRIESLHPLQLLLARTVTCLDLGDEALLKRTRSQLLSCVSKVNSMSRDNIKQLAAASDIAEKDTKLRQRSWMEYVSVVLSAHRLLAMKPNMDSAYNARNAASSLIAKFLRQKIISKTLTKKARAARVLGNAVLYYLRWVQRIRKKRSSAEVVKQFLIELRDVHPAAKTIKKFRKRVISIQRMVRHFLMRRNFLYMKLLSRWIRVEEKQRKQHNANVQFKYEEKPSVLEPVRIKRLRKAIQEKQRNWMEELRKYLRATQVYKDELEVSRMLRMQMECFMQGRALPDSVIRGLPKDTRRIYKKLNSNPPKFPTQNFEVTDVELKRLVAMELFSWPDIDGKPKMPKKAAFVDETGCKSETSRKPL